MVSKLTHYPTGKTQVGVALLAGLLMMAAISLLALTATSSMIMQQRMAGNFADDQHAFKAALFAVSQGEHFVLNLDHGNRQTSCLENCFSAPLGNIIHPGNGLPANPEFEDVDWWNTSGTVADIDPVTGDDTDNLWDFSSETPRFLIQELYFDDLSTTTPGEGAPTIEGIAYYRILGRGQGLGPAAVAVTEAIVARPWLNPDLLNPDDQIGDDLCADFESWYHCGRMSWRQRR
jgi:Tfp pilus assembly protein PilX